jgi:pyruvate dehydrogenase kinase 2/3/4
MFKGPPVQLICPKDLIFPYVPGHLSHICFELLKNSLRAVVERYGVDQEDNFPPIKVVVVEGKEDITIKISDEGGGIPRSAFPLIWTYMYTTMESKGIDSDFQASDFKAPMAGFGYGLPLSRLVRPSLSLPLPLLPSFLPPSRRIPFPDSDFSRACSTPDISEATSA